MDKIAMALLTRATKFDQNGRKLESLKLYEDGIEILLKEAQDELDSKRKQGLLKKILEYMTRAEQVKELVTRWKSSGEIRDKIHIMDGATGYSYERVFGQYMTDEVKEILIEEPDVRDYHHIIDLVMFCEFAVIRCKNLKFLKLLTIRAEKNNDDQGRALQTLKESLQKQKISFLVKYSPSMHDRQVILSNGYIVKIGRGLHYFRPTPKKYGLGSFNYHFRECKETNIDVFYCPETYKP